MKLARYNELARTVGVEGQYRLAVISLHGLLTTGKWQKRIVPQLQDAGILYFPADYGYSIAFAPRALARRAADEVLSHFQDISKRKISACAIGHSFGTFALAHALKRYSDIRFKRVILWGSILSRYHDWHAPRHNRQIEIVLNEVCRRDLIVRCSPLLPCRGTGWSGCSGFKKPASFIYNFVHEDMRHSDLLTDVRVRNVWIPFLHTGRPPQGARPAG